jgi:hypothetical protein
MLTSNEKILLRDAIFDGFFEAEYGVISKSMLEAIDLLDDDTIRAKLNEYTIKRDNDKMQAIAELEARLNELRGDL